MSDPDFVGSAEGEKPCSHRFRQLPSHFQQALTASVDTLQLLHQHKQAASPVVHISAALLSDSTASNDLRGRSLGSAASLGILRCLPYELPMLRASTVYQDSFQAASSRVRLGITYSASR